jgi:hypothetical protein
MFALVELPVDEPFEGVGDGLGVCEGAGLLVWRGVGVCDVFAFGVDAVQAAISSDNAAMRKAGRRSTSQG